MKGSGCIKLARFFQALSETVFEWQHDPLPETKMSNSHEFHQTPVDDYVRALTPEARRQIMHDFDELQRTGISGGDTALRAHAGILYRQLHREVTGFNAEYLMKVGHAVHKAYAVDAIMAEERLDHDAGAGPSF